MAKTKEEAIEVIRAYKDKLTNSASNQLDGDIEVFDIAIKALEQGAPIDKSAMMYEIYMKGVNMTDEYQGCWVRFKDIEKIVDKYMTESDEQNLKMKQYPIGNVLDKIKAEIMQVVNEEKSYDAIWALGLKYAVNIIDKYRKEQTDEHKV